MDLTLKGLAFIAQEGGVSACATTALWCAFHKSAHQYGLRIPSLYEITSTATRYLQSGRPIPSTGLRIEQMISAVSGTGLDPEHREILKLGNDRRWFCHHLFLSALYGYLRAGIPVVLAVHIIEEDGTFHGGHALTLIGYRLSSSGPGFDEIAEWSPGVIHHRMKLKGSRVCALYANDDAIGPYCKLWVEKGDVTDRMHPYPFYLQGTWEIDGVLGRLMPRSIIIPLYPKIRLPFIRAYKLTRNLNILFNYPATHNDIEWDLFLSSVNDYKLDLSRRRNIPRQFRKRMLEMSHPRFFWRARGFRAGVESCEMLIDATEAERSFQPYALNFLQDDLNQDFVANRDVIMRDIGYLYKGVRELVDLADESSEDIS